MFKEVKKTISKEYFKSLRMMSPHIENINEEIEIIKDLNRNFGVKYNSWNGLHSRFEFAE